MANASFCPACGDIVSDGCADEFGEDHVTPCSCVPEESPSQELETLAQNAMSFMLGHEMDTTEIYSVVRGDSIDLRFINNAALDSAYAVVRLDYDVDATPRIRYYFDTPLSFEPVVKTVPTYQDLIELVDLWMERV